MTSIWAEISGLESSVQNLEYLMERDSLPLLKKLHKEATARLDKLYDKVWQENQYVDRLFKEE